MHTRDAATTGRPSNSRAARIAARRTPGRSLAVRPGLPGGAYKPLSDRDLERIHDTVLAILANIGLSAVTDEIREVATAKGARLNEHGRLCFPRALVEDVLATAAHEVIYHGRDPERTVRSGGNRVYFATSGEAVRFVDPETGVYRPSTLLDLYDFFRMADYLDHIDFCGQQVVATDICEDARLHALNIAYAGAAATTKPFSISLADAATVREVEALWDTILGGDGAFRRQPFAAIGVCPIVSPLRFGPDTSAVLCEAARRGLPVSACTAPQAGATAPAALAGALAQSTAEALAIVTLVNLINPGGPVDFGPWTFVSDLRTGAFTGGGGEEAVLQAAAGQIARYYRLPGLVAAGMTDAKRPDYQAGYEKGMSIALSALAGSNMICECAGMMGSLFGCSLESMVMDNDLLGAVQRSLRGIEVTDETLSYEIIESTVLGPCHYLGAEQTLSLMQTEYLYPRVGDRSSLSEWQYRGSPELMTAARARVREIMASHYPSIIDPARDAAIRSACDIRIPSELMRPGNGRWPAG
ncbi:MAG TPA: trimethylamine methyltransferase family protein [Steroidobacteraceae bacterium]|nr:trimethylamine methyltransferase family protein [Steroidobacteraceae bacterium]